MREKRWYQRLWWRAMVPALVPLIDPSEDPHDGVELTNPFSGERVQIDRGIVHLVQELWEAGVETFNSCEGDADLYELAERRGVYSMGNNAYSACVTVGSVGDSQYAVRVLTNLIHDHGLHCNPPLVSTDLRSHDQAHYWHVRFEPKLLGYSTGESHHGWK